MPPLYMSYRLPPVMSASCDFCMVFRPMLQHFFQSWVTLLREPAGSSWLCLLCSGTVQSCPTTVCLCWCCPRPLACSPWVHSWPLLFSHRCLCLSHRATAALCTSSASFAFFWELTLQVEAWRLHQGITWDSWYCLFVSWLQSRIRKII